MEPLPEDTKLGHGQRSAATAMKLRWSEFAIRINFHSTFAVN